jgi:hypothetical protein
MFTLLGPASLHGMTPHPNLSKTQAAWDGIARNDLMPAAEITAPDVQMSHGPGAGPFAGPGRGLDRVMEMSLYFGEVFAGTWHQSGQCVYADDACSVTLVHETGTADKGVFDNRALWISRFGADGLIDALWTIDLDQERVSEFWQAHSDAST